MRVSIYEGPQLKGTQSGLPCKDIVSCSFFWIMYDSFVAKQCCSMVAYALGYASRNNCKVDALMRIDLIDEACSSCCVSECKKNLH